MTRMRYVKMDRIMNHMLIHALREVFRESCSGRKKNRGFRWIPHGIWF